MTGYLIIGAIVALFLANSVAVWIVIIGVLDRLDAAEFRELQRERARKP